MKAILFVVLIQLGNVSVANSAAAKAELEVSLSGTLHGGIMAIGGETTGWELAYSKNAQRSTVEVDMEAIEKAMSFDGKKVTISGELGVKNYLERGAVRILTAKTVVLGKSDNRRGGEQNKSENQQLLAHAGEALRLSRRSKFFSDREAVWMIFAIDRGLIKPASSQDDFYPPTLSKKHDVFRTCRIAWLQHETRGCPYGDYS